MHAINIKSRTLPLWLFRRYRCQISCIIYYTVHLLPRSTYPPPLPPSPWSQRALSLRHIPGVAHLRWTDTLPPLIPSPTTRLGAAPAARSKVPPARAGRRRLGVRRGHSPGAPPAPARPETGGGACWTGSVGLIAVAAVSGDWGFT